VAATATGLRRWAWFSLGWISVAVGSIGVVVPGVPTTGPFVLAAACFARSSPRFERWVFGLPGVGRMVRDHRAGLGMPRRAKVMAIGVMLSACSISAVTIGPPVAIAVVLAAAVATWYIGWRVPTRERVLADADAADPAATATTTAAAQTTTEPSTGPAGP
jgi:uncharacterized membrane protein YbaN (DUF454 family)